jgi:hypothetical protein
MKVVHAKIGRVRFKRKRYLHAVEVLRPLANQSAVSVVEYLANEVLQGTAQVVAAVTINYDGSTGVFWSAHSNRTHLMGALQDMIYELADSTRMQPINPAPDGA